MVYVIGIDQSTQGTKVILYDANGKIVKKSYKSHEQMINELGWVSHDPEEIYQNVISLVREVIDGIDTSLIASVGITNQRETALAWNKETALPAENAIVWQCNRAKEITDSMNMSSASLVKRKTGLPLSPCFSAAKFTWFLNHYKDEKDTLLLGTIDTWLVYKLTNGRSYKTDVSNASRTQLMSLETLDWDGELLNLFGISRTNLPEIQHSDSLFGYTDFEGILPAPIAIHAVMGDSHAALFAHKGSEPGSVKATYGTGSSIMMNIGRTVSIMPENLAVSVGWASEGVCHYVLEGNVHYAGAVISWMKDQLEFFSDVNEIESMVANANFQDQTYLIPAFTGIGAPYFRDDIKASFVGMTRTTGKCELVRAGLESIAYQINAVISAMKSVSSLELKKISVDGGPTRNNYLMQFQSNLANAEIDISEVEEASCTGVAYMAGIASGCYGSEILDSIHKKTVFPETAFKNERLDKIAGWERAVSYFL